MSMRPSTSTVQSHGPPKLLPGEEPHPLDEAEHLFLQLPPRQRAALFVTEYLGYDSAAAAEILGVRAGTVRTLVSKAKARLKNGGAPK